jgi:NAD(P)-dependent dehydrogenase (short-subunit alcohol dehydrogenase family)
MKQLKGKTVFITGGLTGIGKACAIAAAMEGANVVIADIKSVALETTLKEIRAENSSAEFIECDVASMESVNAAIAFTMDKFKSLDVALNNAGVAGEAEPIHEISEENWNRVIRINLTGVFNCLKQELKIMLNYKKGVIINMASILGKVGFIGSAGYVAAKHGVIGLTKTAALEYAGYGIRVNAICPGFVDSQMLSKGGLDENETAMQKVIAMHPMNRLGKTSEIAMAFLFLASNESTFVTGASLDVDGGYLTQ